MTQEERRAVIIESKQENSIIKGFFIDLYPCKLEYGEEIIRLRNQERSRYNFNQLYVSTIELQHKWFVDYENRDNDIYWCINDKKGNIVGTVRLYNIEIDGSSCHQGSLVIDESLSLSGPYAVETEILTLNYCFDKLQVETIIIEIRADNNKMISISKRIGFSFLEKFVRDGANYNYYNLTKQSYNKDYLENLLKSWTNRL